MTTALKSSPKILYLSLRILFLPLTTWLLLRTPNDVTLDSRLDPNSLPYVIVNFDHMKKIIPLKINLEYFLQLFTIFIKIIKHQLHAKNSSKLLRLID